MKIHEYQAKALLRRYGVSTPEGMVCASADEAVAAARALGGTAWAVKAQIHAGGRGKGGGIKVAHTLDDVGAHAEQLLAMRLVTPQTGPRGQPVRRVLVEEGLAIEKEIYIGLVVDRGMQRVCLMASADGGVDIETVAANSPERIHRFYIDPLAGLGEADAANMARRVGMSEAVVPSAQRLLQGLWQAFDASDATLIETNPLVVTRDGRVLALDAKMDFDANALFRHSDIAALRDLDEEDAAEIEASHHGLAYISLDGDIGCLVNGAGLAMATMDIIKLYGGAPANFLDVGGGASTEKVIEAFKIMLKSPGLKAILVNIFGGIMKCDVIATALTEAAKVVSLSVPLVVRLEGTHVDFGKRILADSGLPIISASNMADAAAKVVAAARGAG